jgi:hypothetical protein
MFDEKFLQNLILLGATALVTGLLVPYILKVVDYRKTMDTKEREATLARQGKIIESQSTLLDDLTASLWRWRYLCMRVTYYGGQGNGARYDEAEKAYDESFWDVMNDIRNEITRTRWLVSEGAYKRLLTFYGSTLVEADMAFSAARRVEDDLERRKAFIRLNEHVYYQISSEIDEALHDLANELKLHAA